MIGLDDVDDGLHDGRGREELTVIVRLLHRELGEKVFVDTAEHIAGRLLDQLTIEHAHEVFEHLGLEDAVVLGQYAEQGLELGLNSGHGLGDEPGQVSAADGGLLHDRVVASGLRQIERAARDVVGRQHLALRHLAAGLVGVDLPMCRLETVGRVAQEDHAQHRHEVVAGVELGVGAQIVRRRPQVGLEFFDVLVGVSAHAG